MSIDLEKKEEEKKMFTKYHRTIFPLISKQRFHRELTVDFHINRRICQ